MSVYRPSLAGATTASSSYQLSSYVGSSDELSLERAVSPSLSPYHFPSMSSKRSFVPPRTFATPMASGGLSTVFYSATATAPSSLWPLMAVSR